jgi:hypothetical protein
MRLLAFRRVELIDVEAASICCNANSALASKRPGPG